VAKRLGVAKGLAKAPAGKTPVTRDLAQAPESKQADGVMQAAETLTAAGRNRILVPASRCSWLRAGRSQSESEGNLSRLSRARPSLNGQTAVDRARNAGRSVLRTVGRNVGAY
jgi:hypothetical protein